MGGECLDTRNPTSKLMLTILAGVATWEREIMLERQREGIAKAESEGKYKGRPASIDAAQIRRLPRWVRPLSPSNSVSPAARSTGCSSKLSDTPKTHPARGRGLTCQNPVADEIMAVDAGSSNRPACSTGRGLRDDRGSDIEQGHHQTPD
jgi:DNA invertase Pin-like site-specific DNA recombinase